MRDHVELLWKSARAILVSFQKHHEDHTLRGFTVTRGKCVIRCGCGKSVSVPERYMQKALEIREEQPEKRRRSVGLR